MTEYLRRVCRSRLQEVGSLTHRLWSYGRVCLVLPACVLPACVLIGSVLIASVLTASVEAQDRTRDFESAHTVERAQLQHQRLPADDIWWTVNGKDMAWNFKNLHQIFPTVNVYRHGPVSKLEHQSVPA